MATWLPLESNPEVMNKFIQKLGVTPAWSLTDVYALDEEMLNFVPKPVKALILLFPCTDIHEKHHKDEDESLKSNPPTVPEDLFYMKQVIHNACGTIALVHSIANNPDIKLNDGILKDYIEKARKLTPEERGTLLESDDAFTNVHQELALEGQTASTETANHHFVALVNKNGVLFELDGRKSFPISHGNTTDDTFLNDAVKVCKAFMARDPEEVRFTVIALTSALD